MLGELSREQIEDVLRSADLGRIGCHAAGRTYVVPIAYVYDGTSVYGRSADGLKVRTMRANPNVCFEVEQIDAPMSWRTVIAWGTYEELSGAEEDRARELLISHFAQRVASEAARPRDATMRRIIVFRIRLHEKTGRFEQP